MKTIHHENLSRHASTEVCGKLFDKLMAIKPNGVLSDRTSWQTESSKPS